MLRSIVKAQLPRCSLFAPRSFHATAIRAVKVGDSIPSAPLYEGSPGNEVNLAEEIGKAKALIIGVPGAFSPACSASHVPGYYKLLRDFNDKGITHFYVIAVNDPFVTKAWSETISHTTGSDQVRFLADSRGEFSRDWDVLFDASKVFGGSRSGRYAVLVENGKVAKAFVEPDNTSVDVSAASKVLESLE
ncbi:hypothetical protein FDK38_004374 [Candidozyma auris]|nr:hypothetical protein FDK38_004374 [[Candida] auris]